MEIITAKQAAKQSRQSLKALKTVQNTVYNKNTDFDLSTLDCVMRNIESAIDKGEYSVEINSNPHEIKSHINPEKRIWVDMCNWILDENSKTHQTLKENGFHISKTPHPKKRFKYIFIVTISWN